MRVGGPAARVIEPATELELIDATRHLWRSDMWRTDDWLLLGGGSNVVVSDEGFDGTVIRVVTRGIEVAPGGGGRLRVQAGEPWDAVVECAVEKGWAGIEALSGIPGSSGAAPIQNIGAYGQELASSLVAVDLLDYPTGELVHVPAAELELGYRSSALKRGRLGLVVAIELALTESSEGVVEYAQLAQALGVQVGARVPIATIRESVRALRASKGMLLDDNDPDSVSCGSFFTNPIVGENFARGLPGDAPRWLVESELEDRAVPLGSALPELVGDRNDMVKLSAAWLIERSGIGKGFALPGSRAAVSAKHTLAIVNRGGARAEEIAELARYIEARVLSEFGIHLQPEPVAIGLEL
jgi:UDP-N-acetylmuramate dehydrogenase